MNQLSYLANKNFTLQLTFKIGGNTLYVNVPYNWNKISLINMLIRIKKPIWACRRDFLKDANALFINVVSSHIKILLIELSKRLDTSGNTFYVNVPYNWIKYLLSTCYIIN